jgi:hypothetical protein
MKLNDSTEIWFFNKIPEHIDALVPIMAPSLKIPLQ